MNSEAPLHGPVIVSAGGTGGHMFPAFALARALQARGVPVMMATDTRGLRYRDDYADIPFIVFKSDTVRAGLLAKLRMVFLLLAGIGQASVALRRIHPRAVVGFGGYSSFPAVIAAQMQGIPTMIHEQNAVLGRANKMLAGRAMRIALSLRDLSTIPDIWHGKTVVTGNPVRADVVAIEGYMPPSDDFRILVFGGSQGATVFSRVVPEAIGLLPEDLRTRLRIVQQCRQADLDAVRSAYEALGVQARLETFIGDVPAQMAACHLLVARSGASTVAEAAVAGRPALFVPYPHHKDQQQRVNAGVLVRAGAARMFDEKTLNPAMLAKELETLMQNPAHLAEMAANARQCAIRDAADRLADAVISL